MEQPALNPGRLPRDVALNLAGHLLPLAAALPAIPLIVAHAGAERFGLLTLAWTLIGYLNVLDVGTGRALTQGIAERRADGRARELAEFVRSGLMLAGGLSVAFALPLALLAPWLVGLLPLDSVLAAEARRALVLVALGIPFAVLSVVGRGVLEGFEDFRTANAVRIPMGVGTFAGPVLALVASTHLAALVGGVVAARALGTLAYLWAVRRAVARLAGPPLAKAAGPAPTPRSPLGDLLRYGGWITVSNVVSPLMLVFDRMVIAALLGAGAVAFYTAPFEVVHRLVVIPTAIAGVFFPAFARAWAGSAPAPATLPLLRTATRWIALATIGPALVLLVFAPGLLTLWLGEAFAEAGTPVARILVLGVMCNALAHVPYAFVQAAGRPRWTAMLHLVELPLYLLALWWALPRLGIEGAAGVWSARLALDLVLLSWLARRLLQR